MFKLSMYGFNTQPPEGGWFPLALRRAVKAGFNTQPPEGGWAKDPESRANIRVSTHSRPKAAG